MRKLVDQEIAKEVQSSGKKIQNIWRITKVEVMGKVYAMTDTSFTVKGTKQDAIDALKPLGKVSSARDMLRSEETICGYRTVDMFLVQQVRENIFFFAERI